MMPAERLLPDLLQAMRTASTCTGLIPVRDKMGYITGWTSTGAVYPPGWNKRRTLSLERILRKVKVWPLTKTEQRVLDEANEYQQSIEDKMGYPRL